MQGLIGRKLGMTQVYDDKGQRVAVTVLEAGPCQVVQRKTGAIDGYEAVQLGFGECKEKHATKAAVGRFKKANLPVNRWIREFALDTGDDPKVGDAVTTSIFTDVSHVDIEAVSKGRGFQGVVRRHGMRGGPLTHGGHSKRRVGSVGQKTWPARIHPGQRMPGHMGNCAVTTQNLRVVTVRGEENLLLVEGAVPGPSGAVVFIRKAIKKAGKAR